MSIPSSYMDQRHQDHVEILLRSFRHWTGRNFITPTASPEETARLLFLAPFAVLSHGIEEDPIFNYGNAVALELFELSWEEFTCLHSKQSAEQENREQRAQVLARVSRDGYIDDYRGIRISSSGRRFEIQDAMIWNLLDADGAHYGQAARINKWQYL